MLRGRRQLRGSVGVHNKFVAGRLVTIKTKVGSHAKTSNSSATCRSVIAAVDVVENVESTPRTWSDRQTQRDATAWRPSARGVDGSGLLSRSAARSHRPWIAQFERRECATPRPESMKKNGTPTTPLTTAGRAKLGRRQRMYEEDVDGREQSHSGGRRGRRARGDGGAARGLACRRRRHFENFGFEVTLRPDTTRVHSLTRAVVVSRALRRPSLHADVDSPPCTRSWTTPTLATICCARAGRCILVFGIALLLKPACAVCRGLIRLLRRAAHLPIGDAIYFA